MVRDATQNDGSGFQSVGVIGAHAHRFRHTLATEMLEAGGTFEDAAEVLGNSPNISEEALRQMVNGKPGTYLVAGCKLKLRYV